jgi:hypothetical protein
MTAEKIPTTLWSSKVPYTEQRAIADSLSAVKPETALLAPHNRFVTEFGKRKFPATVTLTTTFADFASIDSWQTADIRASSVNTEFYLKNLPNNYH